MSISNNTRYYKLNSLERALVDIAFIVRRPQENRPIHLMPTQVMMLLEAARLGAAQLYQHPELLDAIKEYPFP